MFARSKLKPGFVNWEIKQSIGVTYFGYEVIEK